MSNRPNPRGAGGSRAVAKAQSARRRPSLALWVLIGILGLSVVAVIVAAVATKEDKVAGQQQPVTVTGQHLPLLPSGGADPAVGSEAPLIEGRSFDGSPVTIGGESDQPTLAVFVAHWCPHCQREVPLLVEWEADGTIPDDIRLVAIATSTSEAQPNYPPQDWLEGEQWPADIMADSEGNDAAEAYGLAHFPYFVAINADGTIAARGEGELDQQGIEDLVATLEGDPAS